MNHSKVILETGTGMLHGKEVTHSVIRIRDLKGIFQDEMARTAIDQDTPVYSVQYYMPVDEGTNGGLFIGNTIIFPGKVGKEYFMTRGHFHSRRDRAEFYWCVKGQGVLILMNEDRRIRSEIMKPGSLHYIHGFMAHRVANTGKVRLVLNACWPSDAGHDYNAISDAGFSARLLEKNSKPELVIL